MKVWILVTVAVGLLLWSLLRERFEATPSIKAPPYDAAEKRRIFDMVRQRSPRPPYSFLGYQDILMDKAKSQLPTEAATMASSTSSADAKRAAENKLKEAAGAFVTPAIEAFFTGVFKPATTPITDAQVDTFVDGRVSDIKMIEKDILKTYFVGQSGAGTSGQGGADSYAAELAKLGQNAGYLVSGSGATPGSGSAAGSATPPVSGTSSAAASTAGTVSSEPAPVCPMGTIMRDEDKKCVSQAPSGNLSCPSGYTLGADKKCKRNGGTETTNPSCPAGFTFNSTAMVCDSSPVDPTCPGGYEYKDGKCKRKATTPPATTTGGSSTSTWGPTTGGPTSRLRQIFGPQFTGQDGDLSQNGGDSSQTNVYPELLGGLIDSSSRIPGAGIQPPSKNWTLAKNGSLPPQSSMGADEMARYFPFSRTPGDMDVIPDPYRVAQTFSASSYASKTEPVPFLTDFSAFQK